MADDASLRRYIRLPSIFPVELYLPPDQAGGCVQGYTRNVSEGGLCFEVHGLTAHMREFLQQTSDPVNLVIHLPLSAASLRAAARVKWCQPVAEADPEHFQLGCAFLELPPAQRRRLIGAVRRVRWLPQVIATVALVSLIATMGLAVWDVRLYRAQHTLLAELDGLRRREESLVQQQAALERRLAASSAPAPSTVVPAVPPQPSPHATAEEAALAEELIDVQRRTAALEAQIADHLLTWLTDRQDARTGLLVSIDADPAWQGWALTYDQALAAQALLLLGHEAEAARVLAFYRPRAGSGFNGFPNAYQAANGRVAEAVVHTGPTLWIGIAALQYVARRHDPQFVPLATAVADWALALQAQDPEGGLREGPYLTGRRLEHNIDGYAFFTMAATVLKDPKYAAAAQQCRAWLAQHAAEAPTAASGGVGDATPSSGTLAWLIAGLGADQLAAAGQDPDALLQDAATRGRAAAVFSDGRRPPVPLAGFALPAQSTAVSTEWTGQMVLLLQLLADFHEAHQQTDAAEAYQQQARRYLTELEKMVVAPSAVVQRRAWALPYATEEVFETGHGWRTAHGTSSGSVSATAWLLFASVGYNPLAVPASD